MKLFVNELEYVNLKFVAENLYGHFVLTIPKSLVKLLCTIIRLVRFLKKGFSDFEMRNFLARKI